MILVVNSILMYYYNMIRMKKNLVKINKLLYLTIKLWLGFYLSNIIYTTKARGDLSIEPTILTS